MNHEDRIAYTALAFQAELEPVIKVLVYKENAWEEQFVAQPLVDPLNLHKPYGLVAPQRIQHDWVLGISPAHFIRPFAEDPDETRLGEWIEYWAHHMFLHVVLKAFFAIIGRPFTHRQLEEEIDEEFQLHEPDLFHFGAEVRMLNPT